MSASAQSKPRSQAGRKTRQALWSRLRSYVAMWHDVFARHDLITCAGAIAFEMFVASIALVLLGLGVLGAIGREDVWDQQLAPQLEKRFLPEVYRGIDQTAQRIFAHDSKGLMAFAAALALWEVSRAVRACMRALTRIYGGRETRPGWLRFGLSVAIAAVVIVSLLGAIMITIAWQGPSGAAHVPVAILRWAFAICLLALAFGLLVRVGPAESRATRWVSVGAVLVVAGWVVQSLLFRWYVTSVASFRSASGSLTAFILVTTYFLVAAIVLLVGIELDEMARRKKDGGGHAGPGLARRLMLATGRSSRSRPSRARARTRARGGSRPRRS